MPRVLGERVQREFVAHKRASQLILIPFNELVGKRDLPIARIEREENGIINLVDPQVVEKGRRILPDAPVRVFFIGGVIKELPDELGRTDHDLVAVSCVQLPFPEIGLYQGTDINLTGWKRRRRGRNVTPAPGESIREALNRAALEANIELNRDATNRGRQERRRREMGLSALPLQLNINHPARSVVYIFLIQEGDIIHRAAPAPRIRAPRPDPVDAPVVAAPPAKSVDSLVEALAAVSVSSSSSSSSSQ